MKLIKLKLNKKQAEWLIQQVQSSVNSVRIDGRIEIITFDENNFEAGDYIEYGIKEAGEIYAMIKEQVEW